ncbi:MAG: SDR family NAD(P)-dependent oxidoreductase [Proteobacteria bacterium]|nr:SDR family NAD(P)-dependent oxidoreductase [Pseudomonadota bacterium]
MHSDPAEGKAALPRVALVTGASSGIGLATAKKLASMGLHVVACARRMQRLEALCRELAPANQRVLPIQVDLRVEGEIAAMFASIRERWGGVDIVVNNAGLGHSAPLLSGDTASWREILEVNVLALCICTREAVADMERRGVAGHVIHISSMSGHRVPRSSGLYSASKHAVRSLTESLRLELRERNSPIRVSSVSPGFVDTEFAAHYYKSDDARRTTYQQYRVLQAEDVAEAVAFIITQPSHVQIHDILMRSTEQRM